MAARSAVWSSAVMVTDDDVDDEEEVVTKPSLAPLPFAEVSVLPVVVPLPVASLPEAPLPLWPNELLSTPAPLPLPWMALFISFFSDCDLSPSIFASSSCEGSPSSAALCSKKPPLHFMPKSPMMSMSSRPL